MLDLCEARRYLDAVGSIEPGFGKRFLAMKLTSFGHEALDKSRSIATEPQSTPQEEIRPLAGSPPATASAQVVVHGNVHGNVNPISSSGPGAQIFVKSTIKQGDTDALVEALIGRGMPTTYARELAKLAADEEPKSEEEPFGRKVGAWLKRRAGEFVKHVSWEDIMTLLRGFHGLS